MAALERKLLELQTLFRTSLEALQAVQDRFDRLVAGQNDLALRIAFVMNHLRLRRQKTGLLVSAGVPEYEEHSMLEIFEEQKPALQHQARAAMIKRMIDRGELPQEALDDDASEEHDGKESSPHPQDTTKKVDAVSGTRGRDGLLHTPSGLVVPD